jgi:hypothetical protein
MSNKNPKIVIDAIIDSESSKITKDINVYPVTIRRYAFLEKLNSPFINSEVKFDVNGIIPSVYVMTLTKDELKKYNSNDIEKLISDSFDWSDSLNMDDVPKMITAVTRQFTEINRASPDATDNNSKKK